MGSCRAARPERGIDCAGGKIRGVLCIGTAACVGYTIWSMVTGRQIAGWLIRMQTSGDDGSYSANYTWVMTLLIVLGILGVAASSLALVRALLAEVAAAHSLGWLTKLALFAVAVALFAWVRLREALPRWLAPSPGESACGSVADRRAADRVLRQSAALGANRAPAFESFPTQL